MRALNAQFELFDAANVLARVLRGNAAGLEVARLAQMRSLRGKYKNRGNEARKYMKTKEVTFLDAAN
jgi:hypothetical protein